VENIPQRHGQTDGHTDRQATFNLITALCVASRGKKLGLVMAARNSLPRTRGELSLKSLTSVPTFVRKWTESFQLLGVLPADRPDPTTSGSAPEPPDPIIA